MTLDQLMAFTVIARPRAPGAGLGARSSASYNKEPYQIRRMLTEGAVRASDKRAQFVGIDAYEAAGGTVLRDLFQRDDGGWLQDVGLLDRLVAEKLKARSRGDRRRRLEVDRGRPSTSPTATPMVCASSRRAVAAHRRGAGDASTRLQAEYDRLEAEYEDADELPDEVDAAPRRDRDGARRLRGPAGRLRSRRDRPRRRLRQHRRATGSLRVERGYVRPEDELPVEPEPDAADDDSEAAAPMAAGAPMAAAASRRPSPQPSRRRTRACRRSPTG